MLGGYYVIKTTSWLKDRKRIWSASALTSPRTAFGQQECVLVTPACLPGTHKSTCYDLEFSVFVWFCLFSPAFCHIHALVFPSHVSVFLFDLSPNTFVKTYDSKPKTDSDQSEGCRNNLSFWRGWKGNIKYLITLWKAKINVILHLPLSTGLTDPDSPQSDQIVTYIYLTPFYII